MSLNDRRVQIEYFPAGHIVFIIYDGVIARAKVKTFTFSSSELSGTNYRYELIEEKLGTEIIRSEKTVFDNKDEVIKYFQKQNI